MARVTTLVSAYFAKEFIDGRLANLMMQHPRPEIMVVAQRGTYEAQLADALNLNPILTDNVPTLYAAWNMAISQSSGEYITNANSDDLLYPGALEVMTECLDENPDIALCYADSDVTHEYGKDPVNRLRWIEGGVEEIKMGYFMGSMSVWRRSLHDKYGYFDPEMRSAGDYEFVLRIMLQGEKVKHIPQALGAYLERKGSIWHSKPLLSVWEVARSRSRYIHEL